MSCTSHIPFDTLVTLLSSHPYTVSSVEERRFTCNECGAELGRLVATWRGFRPLLLSRRQRRVA